MKRSLFCLFLLLLSNTFVQAQLTITPNLSAAQLVAKLVDPSVITANPMLICPTTGNGTFTNTGATLTKMPIATGVILCTGQAKDAEGPNKDDATKNVVPSDQVWATTNHGSTLSDPDLEILAAEPLKDVCKLEMDITSTADSLYVDFVFGSEEYETYVGGGTFNDVFGFFISGPGITGAKNFALVPGTAQPVSVNTINASTNAGYYNANLPPAIGSTAGTIQYNGYTKVMTAKFKVQGGQNYHLKFAIGDKGDGNVDSGVFLKTGSIRTLTVPISLLNFDVQKAKSGRTVDISWSTASERNSDYFELQRSADGINFESIGKVKAAGASEVLKSYSFQDKQAFPGISFYRLKQFDFNGQFNLTRSVSVDLSGFLNVSKLYPNPATNSINADMDLALAGPAILRVFEASGKLVLEENRDLGPGVNTLNLDISALDQGYYLLQISQNGAISALHPFTK